MCNCYYSSRTNFPSTFHSFTSTKYWTNPILEIGTILISFQYFLVDKSVIFKLYLLTRVIILNCESKTTLVFVLQWTNKETLYFYCLFYVNRLNNKYSWFELIFCVLLISTIYPIRLYNTCGITPSHNHFFAAVLSSTGRLLHNLLKVVDPFGILLYNSLALLESRIFSHNVTAEPSRKKTIKIKKQL